MTGLFAAVRKSLWPALCMQRAKESVSGKVRYKRTIESLNSGGIMSVAVVSGVTADAMIRKSSNLKLLLDYEGGNVDYRRILSMSHQVAKDAVE